MSWVPLHVHSQYSILDAAASVKDIVNKSKELNIPAVALTDHGSMYGIVEFFKECKKVGIKPIVGCEVYVAPESRLDRKRIGGKSAYHLVLLAKNDVGYHNLCYLSKIAHLEGFYYQPRIDKETLSKHSEGLVCLSACISGSVPYKAIHGSYEECLEEINWYHNLFGEDYYLEIQRHNMSEDDIIADAINQERWLISDYEKLIECQNKANSVLLQAAKELNIKCVATNDSHYIERDDWRAHEILLNVQSGEPVEVWERDSSGNLLQKVKNPKRRVYSSHEFYFKSPEEMAKIFHDLPETLENTLEIAEKCNAVLDFDGKHYPVFYPPDIEGKDVSDEERAASIDKFLRKLCQTGIKNRYTPAKLAKVKEIYPDMDPLEVIDQRLNYEMSVIVPKGLADYLLIVYDFIDWAKKNNIPVGPGRGSGAGSIICYLIGITDIEPLRFKLLFERFINPERMSYPDIDVDICMDRRAEVIDYMVQKYGQDSIAQIITFGTMKAKMAIKDVGRVLNVPLAKVNSIAKLIPDELNITIERALEIDHTLRNEYNNDDETRDILDIGRRLEGSIRNTGVHAAGVLVCGDPIVNHIPVCKVKDSDMALSQYSMKPVESVGMLKVDFLGLKTLTAIQKSVDAIKKHYGDEIDWADLPLDDEQTFSTLNQGKTLGVFQLESGGMQELARQLHLDRFEEIIAMVSLYRPGPMDMIPSFINRKHGREEIEYDHPSMKDILSETYGIMVYQEQVMQIASELANFSLGEGDVLRRAMGKKDMHQMAQQRVKFRDGAAKNDIDEETSMRIFDKMEKFAAYGFNKSHAAAYGYIAYITAYLKAHYPLEWMAALMSCDRDDIEKVAKFIGEAQQMGIKILPPNINEAGIEFVATKEGIRFAMAGIKGIGEGVVDAIILEREKNGPFLDLYDFIKRIDHRKVGKKAVECLINAGGFDFVAWSRDEMVASILDMYTKSEHEKQENNLGVMTLFSIMEEETTPFKNAPVIENQRNKVQLLTNEKELLGFFLTGHPMKEYAHILERLSCTALKDAEDLEVGAVFRSAFIIEAVSVKISSRSQRKFAILKISDGKVNLELPIWPELFDDKGHLLIENRFIFAVLQVQERDGARQISCQWLDDLEAIDEQLLKECDAAYEKARFRFGRMKNNNSDKKAKNSALPKKTENNKIPETPVVNFELQLDEITLKSIFKIKDSISKNCGIADVVLHFCHGNNKKYSVQLGDKYRVRPDIKNLL